jgi:bifunctional UDP-N-acetylglucosamine pyrophosphorylase/glucosamine-1-phosphate N-acetyltransferase
MSTVAIVLAAGQGTRMKSDLAKVLHEVAGRPMINWVLGALTDIVVDGAVVVVGHQADDVAAVLPPGVRAARQEQQRGTADAVKAGLGVLDLAPDDTILVMPGDMPLLTGETLDELLALHASSGSVATLLTAVLDDPAGYGRILRNEGAVVGVVEQRDGTPEQLAIREVNTSVYVFRAGPLQDVIQNVSTDNSQSEYYLTDVVGLFAEAGLPMTGIAGDPVEVMGVNTHGHLATAAEHIRRRINEHWLTAGVWMQDPGRVYIDADVEIGDRARLYPNVYLEKGTTVGSDAEVGPDVFARAASIGDSAKVWYSVIRESAIGAGAIVGPYVSLRQGVDMAAGTKAGTFVEMKNTTVGEGTKVPHLAYMGDATIGEKTNIGAGSITCNWDGFQKHRTIIGDRVFVGSDSMLVAPLEIGDDAFIGAGSVITQDVSPGALAVERSPQKEIEGYAARRRRRAGEEA